MTHCSFGIQILPIRDAINYMMFSRMCLLIENLIFIVKILYVM